MIIKDLSLSADQILITVSTLLSNIVTKPTLLLTIKGHPLVPATQDLIISFEF